MRLLEPSGSRTSARLIAAALIAAGAAGCSDSLRFGETAFSNPFASRQDASHQVAAQGAPVGQVQAQPPPPQGGAPYQGPTSTYYPPRDTTGSLTSNPRVVAGTEITVEPGDTVTRLAHRYRVSRAA